MNLKVKITMICKSFDKECVVLSCTQAHAVFKDRSLKVVRIHAVASTQRTNFRVR